MSDLSTHATHCCKEHGCKYGDDHHGEEGCPVVSGTIPQEYSCEVCEGEENGCYPVSLDMEMLDNLKKIRTIAGESSLSEQLRSVIQHHLDYLMTKTSKIERKTTHGTAYWSDGAMTIEAVDDPVAPEGDGWRMVGSGVGDLYHSQQALYWFWERIVPEVPAES